MEHDGSDRPLLDLIGESEIIISGTYQDTSEPMNFVLEEEKSSLNAGSLIIDEGMAFYFAKPTSIKNQMFPIDQIDYYGVDHTPSYLWESATRSISAALIVHLPAMVIRRATWMKNSTIKQALTIDKGVLVKDTILRFQNRGANYPHRILKNIAVKKIVKNLVFPHLYI